MGWPIVAALVAGQVVGNWLLNRGANKNIGQLTDLSAALAGEEAERRRQLWTMQEPMARQAMTSLGGMKPPALQAPDPFAAMKQIDPAFLQALMGGSFNPTVPRAGG